MQHQLAGWIVSIAGVCGLGLSVPAVLTVARQALPGTDGLPVDRRTLAVSADGHFVAFTSLAALSPLDTNDMLDVYLLDLERSIVTLESVAVDGSAGRGPSTHPSLSADGRYLLFDSLASNLVADDGTAVGAGIYLRDHLQSRTRRVMASRDEPSSMFLTNATAVMSGDGHVVALSVPGDPGNRYEATGQQTGVYVMSLDGDSSTLVSLTTSGRQPASGNSGKPSINDNGRVVAFTSEATLDPTHPLSPSLSLPPFFRMTTVYVRDLDSGSTTCVGGMVEGVRTRRRAHSPRISGDGRYVAFVVDELQTIAGDVRLAGDIWLYDRVSSTATLVTRPRNGRAADGSSRYPAISAHGEVVVFESDASNLVCDHRCASDARDENLLSDIYLFDRTSGRIRRISGGPQDWWDPSIGPALDGSGRVVVFSSRHPTGLYDIRSDFDLFVWTAYSPPSGGGNAHATR
jgi:Tol biopolymer transport system component